MSTDFDGWKEAENARLVDTLKENAAAEYEQNLEREEQMQEMEARQVEEYEKTERQEIQQMQQENRLQNKEKTMSDETTTLDEGAKQRDPKEKAFLDAMHLRKIITEALKNGTLSCLPGPDGYADTTPVKNLVTGSNYHGINMLYLREHQKQNGFSTPEYVTHAYIDRARQDNPGLFINKGEKGVSIYVSEKNAETGELTDEKHIRLFNVEQLNKPAEMKAWVNEQQEKIQQEKLAKGYALPEKKEREPGPDIKCTSTEPAKYLGQYLAAVSMESRFQATAEQAAEFAKNLEDALSRKIGVHPKTGEPVTNPFELSKISNEANRYCVEAVRGAIWRLVKRNSRLKNLNSSRRRGASYNFLS